MRWLAGLLVLAASWALPGVAMADEVDPLEIVEGWKTSPVYVDPTQQALLPAADAERLAKRVAGHEPAVRIAVVPATALGLGTKEEAAKGFVDTVVDVQQADGVYLVIFGGSISWGSAVGVDTPIAEILSDELTKHSRSDPVGLLDGVLDQMDVPGSPKGTPGWLWPLLVGLLILVGLGFGLRWWKRRPGKDEGPALYRPSYDVLPDEADTLDERQRLAREDVTRFGEELDAADVRLDGVDTATDVQAALDAYTEAGRVVDGEPDDLRLRGVRDTIAYGRWRLTKAQALVAGAPAPARRAACFFDPAHGMSVTDWMYTPAGGRAREIPVCAACQQRLSGGAR